jgi:aspartate aminotransferase
MDKTEAFRKDPSYEFLNLANKYNDTVSFGIGQPFHLPPGEIFSGIKPSEKDVSSYSPALGLPELRERIAEFLGQKYKADLKAGNVAVTVGATSALFMSMLLLVKDETNVYIQDPGFPMYRDVASFFGGRVTYWRANFNDGFKWDCQLEAISNEGGVVVLNFPNNPTGTAASREMMECLSEASLRKRFFIVSDEVYEDFVYENRHYSVLEFPELLEGAVYIGSFSKTWGLAGYRLGYMVASAELIEKLENVAISMYGSPPTYSQLLALKALDYGLGWFEKVREMYKANRDLLVEGLSRIPGVEAYRPGGAFYVFPRVRELAKRLGARNSRELAIMLLERAGVIALPGDAYSESLGAYHLRFSFSLPREKILEGLNRLKKLAEAI